MSIKLIIKQGDSLSLSFYPIVLPEDTYSVSADLRKKDNSLIQELSASIYPPNMDTSPDGYTITLEALDSETLLWPLEVLESDIKITSSDPSFTKHTETFQIDVKEAITD
jgi:hypothetical protein